jgi:hypothetical protein
VMRASHSVGKCFRSYEPAIDFFSVELWVRFLRALRSPFTVTATLQAQHLRRTIVE